MSQFKWRGAWGKSIAVSSWRERPSSQVKVVVGTGKLRSLMILVFSRLSEVVRYEKSITFGDNSFKQTFMY